MAELIGYVGVDSGTLMIGDPCYLDGGFDYDELHHAMDFSKQVHPGPSDYAPPGKGGTLAFSTMWGDGSYPVYAEYKNGRIARVIVEMNGEEEEDY